MSHEALVKNMLNSWVLPIPQRNMTFSCPDSPTAPVFFNATSFLQLPGVAGGGVVSVGFQFRTWNEAGLLLYSVLAEGVLEVTLRDGKVTAVVGTAGHRNAQVNLSTGM